MKYSYYFIIALLFISSCGDSDLDAIDDLGELADNFTISLSIDGAEGMNVYLEAMSQNGNIGVSESSFDHSGKSEMIGNIPGFGLYQLRIGETGDRIIPLTLVPNDKVQISSTLATYTSSPRVKGTKWSKVMSEYMVLFSKFHEDQTELMKLKGSVDDEELTNRFMTLKAKVDQFALSSMESDPSNPFNIVLSSSATPSMGFEKWDPANLEVLKKVSAAFGSTYTDSPLSSTLANQVYQIELEYNRHLSNNSGTKQAPEIALNNPEGVEIKLSSLRGKYVLIDFWASWCGPCRKESPNVVKMYNKYKNQGFTVYSVSLDDNPAAWKGAIASDGLVWPNHVSDLLKWNSPLPQQYGFDGIPHTVLLNKEGNIIGTGLRGASLEQKLKEIFEN